MTMCCWILASAFQLRLRKRGFSEKKSASKFRSGDASPATWGYANQSGYGQGPITGGLFLGLDAANALTDTSKFAVTQDQRNSVHARVRFQAPRHAWLAMGTQYGSGLPADIGNAKVSDLLAAFGQQTLDRVDLARGRVRPNYSFDVAAGAEIYHKESRSVALQVQVANVADRLNVINFASLFSGTALGEPRSVSASLRLTF